MNTLVLFDFDGTLADTAPDLAAAANRQRTVRGLPELPYETLRPVASQGARGLLRVALRLTPEDAEFPAVRDQFLADYAACMNDNSDLFPGIDTLLQRIRDHALRWGIVTNKAARLAEPMIAHLELDAAVIVCGDTTAHAKPHPLPLLHAAERAGYRPEHCIYIGDDERDIQAGQAAGMPTIAAAWGYTGDHAPVDTWGADHIANTPHDVWDGIERLRRAG